MDDVIKSWENIIPVKFMTMGNNDIPEYYTICKKTDSFEKLVEYFYLDYPQYKQKKKVFMVNAQKIEEPKKTIKEMNFKNGEIISIFPFDENE